MREAEEFLMDHLPLLPVASRLLPPRLAVGGELIPL